MYVCWEYLSTIFCRNNVSVYFHSFSSRTPETKYLQNEKDYKSGKTAKLNFPIPARDFEFGNTMCAYSLTQVRLCFSGLIGRVIMQRLDLKGFLQSDEVQKGELRIQGKILQKKRFFTPISRKSSDCKTNQRLQESPELLATKKTNHPTCRLRQSDRFVQFVNGGGGGSRTPVRKQSTMASTYLA